LSTNVDPTGDDSGVDVQEQASDAPSQGGDPWSRYAEAGFSPDDNPYELRQRLAFLEDLTSPERHELALEDALRSWGYLGQGESLDDLRNALSLLRAENDVLYDGDGDGYVDTDQLRQAWQQDAYDLIQQARNDMRTELQAEQLAQDFMRQRKELQKSKGLSDSEIQLAWDRAMWRLQTGNVEPERLETLLADSWNEFETLAQARLAKAAAEQDAAPATSAPVSAPPGGSGGSGVAPRGVRGALLRTAAALGIDPNEIE
jgi:hypothetical protein